MTGERLIHPVILCGGSGTRLWPLSQKARPKPFLPLIGDTSLFEKAVGRTAGDARFAAPIVVAGAKHCDLIEDHMHGAEHRVIVEPAARNTAPAIALAAALLDDDDIMLVCPSDHHIADEEAFLAAALAAARLAGEGHLVAFGIVPNRPETGYGYIRRGAPLSGGFAIAEFVEKPDLARAEAYVASGDYSWNGGIFAFKAGTFLNELEAHRPAIAQSVRKAAEQGSDHGLHFHPEPTAFAKIEAESIDYAVMENTALAAMVPADMGWSDIGTFAALHDALAGDDGGNVARGTIDLVECSNVMAISDGPRVSVTGLEGVSVVVVDGEVLVTSRDGAQLVGKLPGASNQ